MKESVARWQIIAERFRPEIQFSQGKFTEDYFPYSVDTCLKASTLKSHNYGLNIPAPGITELLKYNDRSFYLAIPETVWTGDKDNAPFYVHIDRYEEFVRIEYWIFFAYNGNLRLGVGHHEGDWEHVDVLYNPDTFEISGVYYAAHGSEGGWTATYKKTQDGRPVAYSAWHSHASYARAGQHKRLEHLGDDFALGGIPWSGKCELISINHDLLSPGEVFQEKPWLQWKGDWGSTLGRFGESPSGPAKGNGWHPDSNAGKWSTWKEISNVSYKRAALGLSMDGKLHAIATSNSPGKVMFSHQSSQEPTGWTPWEILSSSWYVSTTSFPAMCYGAPGLLMAAIDLNTEALVFAIQEMSADGTINWRCGNEQGIALPQSTRMWSIVSDNNFHTHILVASNFGLYDIVQENPQDLSHWIEAPPIVEGVISSVCSTTLNNTDLATVFVRDGTPYLIVYREKKWSAPISLPAGPRPHFVVPDNSGLVMFGLQNDGSVMQCRGVQSQDTWSWFSWKSIPGMSGGIALSGATEGNGRLVLFLAKSEGPNKLAHCYWTRQTVVSDTWEMWQRDKDFVTTGQVYDLVAASNADRRVEVFMLTASHAYHSWELAPFGG